MRLLAHRSLARGRYRHLLDDLDAEAFQSGDFARVVGQDADALQVEVREDLRADADFALRLALAFGQGWQALLVMELDGHALAQAFNGVAG